MKVPKKAERATIMIALVRVLWLVIVFISARVSLDREPLLVSLFLPIRRLAVGPPTRDPAKRPKVAAATPIEMARSTAHCSF